MNNKMSHHDAEILADGFLAKDSISADDGFTDRTLLKIYADAEMSERADAKLEDLLARFPVRAKDGFCDMVFSRIRRGSDGRFNFGKLVEKAGFFAASAAVAAAMFVALPRQDAGDAAAEYFLQQDALYTLTSVVETEEFFDLAK